MDNPFRVVIIILAAFVPWRKLERVSKWTCNRNLPPFRKHREMYDPRQPMADRCANLQTRAAAMWCVTIRDGGVAPS